MVHKAYSLYSHVHPHNNPVKICYLCAAEEEEKRLCALVKDIRKLV